MNPNIARRRHEKTARASQMAEQQDGHHNGHHGHGKINVGEAERQLSLLGGSVLALCGLLRGSISGLGLAAIGGALIWRGYTGHCEVYHMLGHSSSEENENGQQHSGQPAHEQFEPQFQGH